MNRLNFIIGAVALVALAYIVWKLSQGTKAITEALPSNEKLLESASIIRSGTGDFLRNIFRGTPADHGYIDNATFRRLSAQKLAEARARRQRHSR